MTDRRRFLKASMLGISSPMLAWVGKLAATTSARVPATSIARVASTWDFGVAANQAAWAILGKGGHALDAVEAGARVPESDLKNHSVGKGGYPDRDGHVTLDASIMDADGSCGAVAAIEHIEHPISVARLVMERTPHVLLVGEGALQFALEQGFRKQDLLTPDAEKAWHEWQKTAHYQPSINSEVRDYGKAGRPGGAGNHDTIGMLAIDAHGRLSGACTTSGMAWKMRGRVGDSPIIGAGLYVDGEVGGATSTGVGEEVIRNAGSFLVVELMRQGRTPHEACKEAVMRIVRKRREASRTIQVGFLAMNRTGEVGAYAIQHGFSYAVCDAKKQDTLIPSQKRLHHELLVILEIAANSVASALAAQEGGAGRVELCTALELGGLTPSYAQIALARERLTILLYVLIRPRAGDFRYSDLECETMRRDIETCVALGCDGVVLGVLDAEGEVDSARCRALIAAAGKLGVTFHRAFDLSRDPVQALEDIVAFGCERILTSGAQTSARDGAALIREFVIQAEGRIAVMPGAGITAQNIAALATTTGAHEFHASAKRQLPSGMQHRRPPLGEMEGGEWRSDIEQVRALAVALQEFSFPTASR